jgi:hypothetical protein
MLKGVRNPLDPPVCGALLLAANPRLVGALVSRDIVATCYLNFHSRMPGIDEAMRRLSTVVEVAQTAIAIFRPKTTRGRARRFATGGVGVCTLVSCSCKPTNNAAK